MPGLSRRLNRIIANCGRAVFRAKLADLKDRFGIEAVEINPAYISQECSRCGYVARDNWISQSRFRCVSIAGTRRMPMSMGRKSSPRDVLAD